jgi:hypothetical protein
MRRQLHDDEFVGYVVERGLLTVVVLARSVTDRWILEWR